MKAPYESPYKFGAVGADPTAQALIQLDELVATATGETVSWLVNRYDMDSYLATDSGVSELIVYFTAEKEKGR
jgi:hypothetical protein